MTDIQKDLLELRKKIASALRAELMGPGSEVSYPDAEHELLSEYPAERYSVGILYPQQEKFGENDAVKEFAEEELTEEDLPTELGETEAEVIEHSEKMYKDESFDDEVNLAQQNKPSSMGLTFFVSGDIDSFYVDVQYAKYVLADDNDIRVPCPFEDLYIPENLSDYISFDKKTGTIKKLLSIKWNELCDLFEKNAIEDPELLNIIGNLNKIFKSRKAYRRIPYNETITLDFAGNIAKKKLENTNGSITAVKHKISNNIFGITVMMLNDEQQKKSDHIFQPKITVKSDAFNGHKFVDYNNFSSDSKKTDEDKSLDLLYRKKSIYGTGHGVSVDWNVEEGRGVIFTEFIPLYEVPKINLNLRRTTISEKEVDDKCLSMKYLSDINFIDKEIKLHNIEKFINCYGDWIKQLEEETASEFFEERYASAARNHIKNCYESYERMKFGIDILRKDNVAWKAFQLTNRAMFMQRIHGKFQKGDKYPNDEELQKQMADLEYESEDDGDTRWRPFQLAFLLLSLNSVVNPTSKDRDYVDLIWFPTGGGKTEAYLGLTAFTIFYRRLLNPENGGTTVIMRYTLRLLTSQQFTRASTLICACEKIRNDEEKIKFRNYNLGKERITIGLWIGGEHAPNTNLSAKVSYDKLTGTGDLKYLKDTYNKFQVLKCPWCGTKLVKDKKDNKIIGQWGYKFKNKKYFYLCCPQEGCEFESSLPIQIVDEELYKNPPTLLFATVDKFAMMAWKKDIKAFFGTDNNDAPDLIIQDELHLISGPLGSMVGIYESAIDYLCSHKGKKPKIVASTATIRQADRQCRALYNREVRQFPAQGLDASDSYFAKEVPIEEDFGRLYMGIMPSGTTKVMLQARAAAAVLQNVYELDCPDEEKDQFYTLAVYFNSLKELGKASSVFSDDVKDFIKRKTYRQIFKKFGSRNIGMAYELTSRVKTAELNDTLDKLENLTYSQKNLDDKKFPVNVLLASNMISVGVDVSRLNLMMLQGQPKSVSEYIQASSRIGRTNPGIAITLYDPSKSRDRSYYEQCKAFHSAFYKYVEPTGVTPFSAPARERALHAVLLSGIRQSIESLNCDEGAYNILDEESQVRAKEFANYLFERIKEINTYNPKGMLDDSEEVIAYLEEFIEEWINKANAFENLKYGDKYIMNDAPKGTPRIIKRFDDKNKDDAQRTLTSLRSVDKTVPISVLIWENEYGKN